MSEVKHSFDFGAASVCLLLRGSAHLLDCPGLIEFSLKEDAYCRILPNHEKPPPPQKKLNSKMLPLVGSEPRTSDFNALHAMV